MSHGDFQLPGLTAHPNGLTALSVTLAFAYSRRWNRRRLEHHTYAFWDKVLSYLIYDLEPNLFLVPQLMIHNPPAEHPDTSIRTDPGANGDEYIPDFSIMGVRAMHRYKSSSSENPRFPTLKDWDRLRIESAKPLVITEVKRTAPRSEKDAVGFLQKMSVSMRFAMGDAEKQAQLAFGVTLYKELDEMILIAACGEWWRFKFATRNEVQPEGLWYSVQLSTDVSDSENEDDKVSYKRPSRDEMQAGHRVSASVQRHTNLTNPRVAVYKNNVEDAMPPAAGQWSKYILFGTEASNQSLFLIHRWLKQQQGEVHLTYAGEGDEESGESDDESEDELLLHG